MKRINVIDMCRGLLFLLMTSTHALTLAGVPHGHWLRSDAWLPNGWGTVVFVVLSGYGVGYLLAHREPVEQRNRKLRRRAFEIFCVMLVSNALFSLMRHIVMGETGVVLEAAWWLGMITLDTPWTISGVLLPTAVLLLIAPWLIALIRKHAVLSVAVFLGLQALSWWFKQALLQQAAPLPWIYKLLLTQGLGGFPLVPFVLNGAIGLWLGMTHRQHPTNWLKLLSALTLIQIVTYVVLHLHGLSQSLTFTVHVFGACAKFACMFGVAMMCTRLLPRALADGIETLGRYALGSFVFHRVYLQVIALLIAFSFIQSWPSEIQYAVLLSGALILTWGTCMMRQRIKPLDAALDRLYL